MFRVPSESSSLASRQSGLDAGKNLLVLDLSGHHGAVTPSRLKVSISLESSPSESQCTAAAPLVLDFRRGFFLDGRDDDVESLGARGVKNQKGKLAVAGDEAEFCFGIHSARPV